MARMRVAMALALVVATGLAAAASGPAGPRADAPAIKRRPFPAPAPLDAEREPSGFRLSEGAPPDERPALVARPEARRLGPDEAARVLERLPPLPADPRVEPFAQREASLPPPRAGRSVRTPFPPGSEGAPRTGDDAPGPLGVLRRMPEGEVPLAPHLSLTFSQPMVALGGAQTLAASDVPVRLDPQPPGAWRWVGTRTLIFEPEGRFPMASRFHATVPAGTKSAVGGALARAESWSFETPAPRLVARAPENVVARRDPVLFAAFDQRVEAAAVLAKIALEAGGASRALRLATEEEVKQDELVSRLARAAEPGRWLAFRAAEPLPPAAHVVLRAGPGVPSAEGSRTSAAAETWRFETYGPFRVVGSECGWNARCTPEAPWRIELSNPIDPKTLRQAVVEAVPELPSPKLSGAGNWLVIGAQPRARTRYSVNLSGTLRDVFGQALEPGATLRFDVGAANPALYAPGGDFVVLDPTGAPSFSVFSTGHAALRVEAFAVTPAEWPAWHAHRQKAWRDDRAVPPGRRVLDRQVAVAGDPDALVETKVALEAALPGGRGQLVVVIRPAVAPPEGRPHVVRAWVQATRIGLDAFADGASLVAWATDLRDGRPLAGVELSLGAAQARSQADGLARLALGTAVAPMLVARQGDDVAILPQQPRGWSDGFGWRLERPSDSLRFYVFDDRRLYRPGEEVRVKGWLRRIGAGPRGDVEPPPADLTTLRLTLVDSQGNEKDQGSVPVGTNGGFDASVVLPATFNLGDATLRLQAADSSFGDARGRYDHHFQVQEFRRPEFEVTTTPSEGPWLTREAATLSVKAAYYAGGALPGAEVTWQVTSEPSHYRPPNRDDFVFGRFVPWWRPVPGGQGGGSMEGFTARTDAAGVHQLRIDFDPQEPPEPRLVTAEATVMDVNRQAWSARSALVVHPGRSYVGLRSERPFVRKGEEIALDLIATDLDGVAVADSPVRLRIARLEWEQLDGEWQEVAHDEEQRQLRSGREPLRTRIAAREGGVVRVLARVADAQGRENETELRIWVAGARVPPRRELEEQELTLVPDRRQYRPGETARVLVVPPFVPAEGVVTLRRSGLVREQRFTIGAGSHTLEIPIEDAFTPNLLVRVDLVGQAPRDEAPDARPRPAFASGSLELRVPPFMRTLALGVKPREAALPPGGETVLELELRDAEARPVADAEAAVVVVDEAVLALTGYRVPDPLELFYAARGEDVTDHRLRSFLRLAAPEARPEAKSMAFGAVAESLAVQAAPLPASMPADAARAGAGPRLRKEAPEPIRARTDLAALALFAPSVRFDAQGRARLPVKLKDSLTRYRVMAVAASGVRRFGSGEAVLVARLPLMVRPSPPRFLNLGDRFELPVVVQNQTDRPLSVDVVVRAQNAAVTDGEGRRLEVAANDRAEVRFPMAAERPGTAAIQVGGVAGSDADAALVELPVWTPATSEAFAAYGEIDAGSIVQPLRVPKDARREVGGLELTTSSTALHALTDAVLYLAAYPFECAEQLSSRVLAVAALRDVLQAFEAEGLPKPDALRAAAARDIERLRALQNDDGGFGFWRRGDRSWPYVSIHVAHALARAKAKGFTVPDDALARSREYLRAIEANTPKEHGPEVRRTLAAYALYTRALLGDADPARARALVREATPEGLSFEAIGFVLPLLSKDKASAAELAALRRRIANGVSETAGAAHFAVSYGDGAHLLLHSDRRADAILLEALVADQPASDLVPKLVAGLLAHRKAGRWASTQENAFVLLALDRYFQAYEKTTPDFVARAWLGERYAGEHAFRGRSTDRQHVQVPMALLAAGPAATDLQLDKQGPGRLYYRIGLRYAPQSLALPPLDRGFTVERAYEGVDSKGAVRRDADGTWRIRAGARVRVRLTLVAPARRYHVALVDPLPAGLEPVNPLLATSGDAPDEGGSEIVALAAPGLGRPGRPGHWWGGTRTWFDHQNLRDERVEAFASLLWDGVYSYRYVARATTPGRFVVAPPRAEEMYSPETFGRGGSDVVVVE